MPAVTPAYTRQNVLVGQARMFLQKLVAGATPALPADTVALNGDWPSSGANIWTPPGATEEGMTLRFQRNTEDINIEEQITPVAVNTTGADMAVETVLSEDTLETWAVAFGGGTITTVAGTPGRKELQLSSDLDHYAFGFEGVNEEGTPRRVLIPEVVSVGQIEAVYRRAASARRYATVFRVICAPEEIEIVDILPAP